MSDEYHTEVSVNQELRHAQADRVATTYSSSFFDTPEADAKADAFVQGVNRRAYVGSRHHTVPRFLLERWATRSQVLVYRRIEDKFRVENIDNLAIKDFYTFIDKQHQLDSSYESLLGAIEAPAAAAISTLMNPFTPQPQLREDELQDLAVFMSFMPIRTTRQRREMELQGEWMAKTLAQGRLADIELRKLTVVPHQNQLLQAGFSGAQQLLPFFLCRPLALVLLRDAQLLIGDEPLVINPGPDEGEMHHPDCFVSDEDWRKRQARERRKKKRLRRPVERVVHVRPTVPRGVGVALEMVLPISPKATLWWGPLEEAPVMRPIEVDRLDPTQSQEFAERLNAATVEQALDWVITRPKDESFQARNFPRPGPLLAVCDGDNAAAAAINHPPTRFRPHRLNRRPAE